MIYDLQLYYVTLLCGDSVNFCIVDKCWKIKEIVVTQIGKV